MTDAPTVPQTVDPQAALFNINLSADTIIARQRDQIGQLMYERTVQDATIEYLREMVVQRDQLTAALQSALGDLQSQQPEVQAAAPDSGEPTVDDDTGLVPVTPADWPADSATDVVDNGVSEPALPDQ